MIEFGDTEPDDAVDALDAEPMPYSVVWLDGLARVCRQWWHTVVEEPGWQRRSRSNNSGYRVFPTTVMVHHTASNTSPRNDINYMTYNASTRPITNIYIDRSGVVYVLAGGPTNTNGKGRDTWGGGTPDDAMNSYAVGIEVANNGVGERYPDVQLDALRHICAGLLTAAGRTVADLRTHFEWAPDRKVDNSGPPLDTPQTPGLKWDMDQFRADVWAIMNEGEDMGLNVTKIRFQGYAEQLVCFRASRDTMETGGILDDQVVVLANPTAAQRKLIEEQLGAPLSPL